MIRRFEDDKGNWQEMRSSMDSAVKYEYRNHIVPDTWLPEFDLTLADSIAEALKRGWKEIVTQPLTVNSTVVNPPSGGLYTVPRSGLNSAAALRASTPGPIRRFEFSKTVWVEFRKSPVASGYEIRSDKINTWQQGNQCITMETAIQDLQLCAGYREVFSGFDPNDMQAGCAHELDYNLDICKLCGKTVMELLYGNASDTYVMPKKRNCECGAHATPNANAHSFWCPEYKK